MTGDSATFADALHFGRFSTALLWIGPSLDRRTTKSKLTAFLWCNSLFSRITFMNNIFINQRYNSLLHEKHFFYKFLCVKRNIVSTWKNLSETFFKCNIIDYIIILNHIYVSVCHKLEIKSILDNISNNVLIIIIRNIIELN